MLGTIKISAPYLELIDRIASSILGKLKLIPGVRWVHDQPAFVREGLTILNLDMSVVTVYLDGEEDHGVNLQAVVTACTAICLETGWQIRVQKPPDFVVDCRRNGDFTKVEGKDDP